MFIRYNDSNQRYSCKVEKMENELKVTFIDEFEPNTSGFRVYSDAGKLLGSYPDHKIIKESYADGFLYSTEKKELAETKEQKTLGKRLEETNKKIEDLKEALYCTNSAMEELLFNYILKEEENTEENE